MDEGSRFPLPPPPGWAWEPEKKASAQVAGDEIPPQAACDKGTAPTGEAISDRVHWPDQHMNPPALPLADVSPRAPSAAPNLVAALIAARDAERDRARRLEQDLRRLVAGNKALRREVLSLRVRGWRDEQTIEGLGRELIDARRGRDRAVARGRQLMRELESLRARRWLPFGGVPGGVRRSAPSAAARSQLLAGEAPFFQRGFRLGEGTAIVGTAVRRSRTAPSGMMVYGPYLHLPAGTYAAAIDARLCQRLPAVASFRAEVVCDGAQRLIEWRRFRLHSLARRRVELVFTVWDGEDYPDFEIRIWARQGTALEIRRLELYRLREELQVAGAAGGGRDGTSGL